MSDSVGRSDDLTAREAAAGGPGEMVAALQRGLAQQGHILIVLGVSVVADIMLSIAAVLLVVHGNSTANLADRNARAAARLTDASYQTCLSSNTARAAERKLWDHVLDTPSPLHLDAAQARDRAVTITALKVYVAANLAPRVCVPRP